MMGRMLLVLVLGCGSVIAGGSEFEQVVKAVGSHYGTKPTHIPLMGVANFFVKVARPEGVSGFKLAVFENLATEGDGEATSPGNFLEKLPFNGMHPIVTVHSRGDAESTYVYASDPGKSTTMLIASFERNEATIVEVKMTMAALMRALRDPEHISEAVGVKREDR